MDMLTYALLNGKISTVSGKVDAIPSPFTYQGSVTNVSDLPASSTKGYLYTVTSEHAYYVYDGSAWTKIGGSDSIFIVTYNTTTYAQITAALNAGKLVFACADGIVVPFNGQDSSNGYTFSTIGDMNGTKVLFETVCSTASAWSISYYKFEELFVATQGTTTYAQVLAAYNAGKVVVAKATNGDYATLSSYESTSLCFCFQHTIVDTTNSTVYIETLALSSEYGWGAESRHINAGDIDYSASTSYRTGTVGKELGNKADIDGYYETLSAGLADNLIDRKGTGTAQEFTFRTACGDESIGDDGNAIVQSVHGNTIVWNQMLNKSNYDSTKIIVGVTFTNNGDGTITANGEATDTQNAFNLSGAIYNIKANHKYYLTTGHNDTNITLYIYTKDGTSITSSISNGIFTATVDKIEARAVLRINRLPYVPTNFVYTPQLFDLTQMFGSGNEPTTVAEFKALFPLDYYAYDEGSLLSFNGTGIKTVGFNQWDEQWELGKYNKSTGAKQSASENLRCKNYIPVFPNTTYYLDFGTHSGGDISLLFYNSNKEYISYNGSPGNTTWTTPSNCYYVTFYTESSYGTTYQNDICINLSWSGYRNGEYEAYESNTLSLPISTYFANGMRSAGSVYDELTKSKAITRIGVVDLGTLTWERSTTYGSNAIFVSSAIATMSGSDAINCVMGKYNLYGAVTRSVFANSAPDKSYAQNTNNKIIIIRDDSYTDATAFKTAMSGVYLFYELATPTEQTISPELDLTYSVQDFGTEQLLPENDDEPTTSPLNAIIKYSEDFTRNVVNLPKNYDSTDGLDALCTALASALSTALNGTFTITRGSYDATNKKYAFTCSFTAST